MEFHTVSFIPLIGMILRLGVRKRTVHRQKKFVLWLFDPIPGHGLPLRGFAITLTGHITFGRLLWTSDQLVAFITEENLLSWGEARIPETLKDGRRKAPGTGNLSARDSVKGTMREGSFTGEPKGMLSKARKWASASVGAPLLGNMDGSFFLGAFLLEEFL
jgi:hypothetical protein